MEFLTTLVKVIGQGKNLTFGLIFPSIYLGITRQMDEKKDPREEMEPIVESWESGKIFLDKEGRWFHEGVEITHRLTVDLFSRSIVNDPDGGYRLQVGKEWAKISVEDTPYMVQMMELRQEQSIIRLNDQSIEDLDLKTLWVGKENVLYCRVKDREFPARFLRPAYYQIMSFLVQDETGFHLQIGEQRCPLRSDRESSG